MLTYLTPDTAEEVLALKAHHGSASLLMGGGTIVMTMMNEGVPHPEVVIGMKRAGLDVVETAGETRRLGAMATIAALSSDPHPMISEAAASCGAWAIRNLATIGGNVFAPAPAGDLGVALMALDANVRISRSGGDRVIPITEFYESGSTIGADEVLTSFEIQAEAPITRFVKFGRKAGPTPSVVVVAVALTMTDGVVGGTRIALGAMAEHPVRALASEAILDGNELSVDLIAEAAAASVTGLDGLTDAIATGWYRKRMAALHVGRALIDIMEKGAIQ